jgi:hypothetical protein
MQLLIGRPRASGSREPTFLGIAVELAMGGVVVNGVDVSEVTTDWTLFAIAEHEYKHLARNGFLTSWFHRPRGLQIREVV